MPILKLSYEPVELGFGTSGLRGLVSDMTDLECYINVRGFLAFLETETSKFNAVYIAGDLRSSTPRIMSAVARAVADAGFEVVNCGHIPTPALAYYAQIKQAPCIMVTGSHIPDDRNGIKFYKPDGEILKADELAIQQSVRSVRQNVSETGGDTFNSSGSLAVATTLPTVDEQAEGLYKQRYTETFGRYLEGKLVVLYQHSAVGRDIIAEVLRTCGARVELVGRSEKFIPIDTENVTPEDHRYFRSLADQYSDAFAILSTDGDSDRPFVVDGAGRFYRGDELGAIVAAGLGSDHVVYPISSNDALDTYFGSRTTDYEHTMIGSPHVIVAMRRAREQGKCLPVGWEVNGGFLIGNDLQIGDATFQKLETRDALFPMLYSLKLAVDSGTTLTEVFAQLPKRYTSAGMIDNFPSATYQVIKEKFSENNEQNRQALQDVFAHHIDGLGALGRIDSLDGIRMYFDNGDIIHVRGSGNAPQLRVYSVSNTQSRADDIVQTSIQNDGALRDLEDKLNEE